ncbi:MAG: hypothetical protein HC822_02595 [Oscillochloris sp.]|nr:hypothetical protein [Oscillochloris sp.]
MKFRMRKPRRSVWNIALILFVAGMAAIYVPGIALLAFPLVALSAALLLLGTSVF